MENQITKCPYEGLVCVSGNIDCFTCNIAFSKKAKKENNSDEYNEVRATGAMPILGAIIKFFNNK